MEGLRVIRITDLTEDERTESMRRARSQTLPHRVVQRAQMVLWNVEGESAPAIARRLGISTITVQKWLMRIQERRLAGLTEFEAIS